MQYLEPGRGWLWHGPPKGSRAEQPRRAGLAATDGLAVRLALGALALRAGRLPAAARLAGRAFFADLRAGLMGDRRTIESGL